ncbi:Lipoprotein-releasing system transmembrane protein LolC [Candidatus Gullanella endobia]|uniref:Lipoprotein-releasing system transmembrane protein LolC n=1 Tax=Candidatus Gullanella endobia TaxID=1070130 RepID=A0A143WRD2_9ENTR|nr:lipoprotein-releasing ABC transporter permease subunit LolC [Candidatus Gullanella endobia]CUX96314.1 Lipoprotein-releasing system transmembrane protein LolC [Candidatus Gullanella endobia]
MYQSVVLYISLRYMYGLEVDRFSRFLSWLSIIGIALGVMALVTISSVMNGFERKLENKILELIPQAILTTSDGYLNSNCALTSIKDSLIGVTRVSPLTTSDVVLQSENNIAIGVMLSVNQIDPEPLSHYLINTRQDDLIAGKYRVILGDKLAVTLGVKYGDIVRLIVLDSSQFTPIGRIPIQRLFTVVGTFSANSEVDDYQLLVNQQDASRLMHYPTGYITGLRLWLHKPLAVDKISSQHLPDGLVWHDWRERKGELFQAVRMEKNMICLLLSLIIVVAVFNIITSLGLMVIKKQTEIAILQTQGLTRFQVMLIFISQGTIIGIIGTLLGTGLGILLASQLKWLMLVFTVLLDDATLPVSIEPLQITIIALLAIVTALLSTIYPSWRAVSILPTEALRYE